MTHAPESPPLVLASTSPRRRAILAQLGLSFETLSPPAEAEWAWGGAEPAEAFAREVALAKARAVAPGRPGALVLAADTIVVLEGDVLGKPADAAEARRMLARLVGREHVVQTGIAIVSPTGVEASGVEATAVRMRTLSEIDIAAYVETGEPLDKAGAYGIQGYGAALVESVSGCYFNVMGLPVTRLLALLRELDYEYRWPGTIARRHPRGIR